MIKNVCVLLLLQDLIAYCLVERHAHRVKVGPPIAQEVIEKQVVRIKRDQR
jgi:hypothetical protein